MNQRDTIHVSATAELSFDADMLSILVAALDHVPDSCEKLTDASSLRSRLSSAINTLRDIEQFAREWEPQA